MAKQNTQIENTIFILLRSWVKVEFNKADCGYPRLCLCYECLIWFLNRTHRWNPALRLRNLTVSLGELGKQDKLTNGDEYYICSVLWWIFIICNDAEDYM